MLADVAGDRLLEFVDQEEHTALQPLPSKRREETLDGVDPGRRYGCKAEHPSRMSLNRTNAPDAHAAATISGFSAPGYTFRRTRALLSIIEFVDTSPRQYIMLVGLTQSKKST
jgi:hypothetical protein